MSRILPVETSNKRRARDLIAPVIESDTYTVVARKVSLAEMEDLYIPKVKCMLDLRISSLLIYETLAPE